MIKYLNILFFLILICCNTNTIDRGIITNDDLIKPFFRNDYLYPENPKYKYVEVANYTFDLNKNDKLDTLKLRVIKDWTDPGDFHQIEITLDNNQSIIETCFDGWVKFGENYPINENLKKSNKINSDLLLITNLNSDKILIFAFGWVYANTPGLMTIVDANGNAPKIIFNDNFELESIRDNSFTGLFGYSGKNKTIKLVDNKFEIQ